ncbi:MAG: phosphatase PAP2 family protein [Acidimicrobiia bacterium]|nr:phosphatase PAP2 family protein [Acidimicrobiia bacterium]
MARRIRVPNTFEPIDLAVDEAWDTIRGNSVADRIFYGASEAANFSKIWHALSIAQAIAVRDPKRAMATSAALGIEAGLVNGPIKSLFERERPTVDERPMKLRQPKTSSFPSGHASAAVVAASFLTPGMPPARKFAVRTLAAVVSTSRIHVQIHHATDVAAGAATGWVLARAIRPVLNRLLS